MPHRNKTRREIEAEAARVSDPDYIAATKREMRQADFERKHRAEHPDEYRERGRAMAQATALEESETSPYEEEAQVQRYKRKLYKSFSR